MDVPVVPAPRLKGHVEYRHLLGRQRGKVALPNEIPGESVILFPYREAGQPVRVYAIILAVDLLDQREGTPRLGPAAVKGKLGHNFHGLLLGDAVGLAQVEVRFQLGIQPRREQCRNGNHAAVTGRELVLP